MSSEFVAFTLADTDTNPPPATPRRYEVRKDAIDAHNPSLVVGTLLTLRSGAVVAVKETQVEVMRRLGTFPRSVENESKCTKADAPADPGSK